MGNGTLTLEKLKELYEAVADYPRPSEVIVMMDDEAFEKAKAVGIKVERIEGA